MVEFREPPERPAPASTGLPEPTWAKVVADRPHTWAMIETFPIEAGKAAPNHRQNWITQGRYVWQRAYAGRWEATYREVGSVYEFFVRYLPGRRGH